MDGCHADPWLEVPAWMFERPSCPGDLQLTAAPFVSLGALGELSALLDQALKTSRERPMRVTTATNSGKHKRPRGRQQTDLFDSARPAAGGAPLWPELPERARSALTEQMAQRSSPTDRELPGTRSRGRSQALLFNEERPHSKLGWMTPRDYAGSIRGETGRHAAQPDGCGNYPPPCHERRSLNPWVDGPH